jgi:hypothetical protein
MITLRLKNKPRSKPEPKQQARPQNKEFKVPVPWQSWLGQMVEIRTATGQVLRGRLIEVYLYELVLETKAQGRVLIGKGQWETCHRLGGVS